jgi:putative phage-type endonuclease
MNSSHHEIFHVIDLEQGTEEWLDWRHSGIGASEASTVMGDNRFQSPSELLYQKKNKINTEPNEKMRLGTSLEPEARDLYIEETGMQIEPLCLQSKEYSWLIASMDGITDDYSHIVEIKCGKSAYWQANKGTVPSYYYGQLQHQLMITGLDYVDYWCYWPGYKGILQAVTRDKPYIRRLLQAEMEFMDQLDE